MSKRHPPKPRKWAPIRVELLAEPVPFGRHGRARLIGYVSDAPEAAKEAAREWARTSDSHTRVNTQVEGNDEDVRSQN